MLRARAHTDTLRSYIEIGIGGGIPDDAMRDNVERVSNGSCWIRVQCVRKPAPTRFIVFDIVATGMQCSISCVEYGSGSAETDKARLMGEYKLVGWFDALSPPPEELLKRLDTTVDRLILASMRRIDEALPSALSPGGTDS